jgi:hypothetical protein
MISYWCDINRYVLSNVFSVEENLEKEQMNDVI